MSGVVPARPADVDERPSRRWRATGMVLGVAVYVGMVVLDIAGFREALPFVVIPPVLVGMIGGGILLGGGQHGRRAQSTPRPLSEYGHPPARQSPPTDTDADAGGAGVGGAGVGGEAPSDPEEPGDRP